MANQGPEEHWPDQDKKHERDKQSHSEAESTADHDHGAHSGDESAHEDWDH